MRIRLMAALIASSLCLTGCELLVSSPMTLSQRSVSLRLRPEVLPGGYRSQAIVKAYTVDDIDHLVLQLFRLDGDTETPVVGADAKAVIKRIPAAKLGETLTFEALQARTTYRIRAFAYKAPGEDPKDLISAPGSASSTDITLTDDDRPVTTLKVKLADVPFNGLATAPGIEVIPGDYVTDRGVNIHLGNAVDLIPSDSPFWAEFLPHPVPGMTWVYDFTRTFEGQTTQGTLRYEVLSVDATRATYRVEVKEGNVTESYENPTLLAHFHGAPFSNDHHVREGEEAITVPLGTYPEATRLVSQGYSGESKVWLVKGIGRVKETVTPSASAPSGHHIVLSLTQFISP